MNVQAHLSGQISGQVSNQAGARFVGLSQQNRNPLHAQMQNLGVQRTLVMDPEFMKARKYMQEKIYEFLIQRQPQTNEVPTKKFFDIVRRLEEGLFKTASTKDEYMNLDTLESRLHVFIKRAPMSNSNHHQAQFVHSSAPVGTMIPTPGMAHHGNSILMNSSSADTSVIPPSVRSDISTSAGNGTNMLPAGNGSSTGMHGGSFHMPDGGSIMPVMGGQRVMSQMIPTPGFISCNSNSFMKVETANDGSGLSAADSLMALQRVPHKSEDDSRMMQSLDNQIGSGRSTIQQRSYALQSGPCNGVFGNNVQSPTGSGSSQSFLTATTTFSGSPRASSQQQLDQQPHCLVQGDRYGQNTSDTSGARKVFSTAVSLGAMMNGQNFNQVRLHAPLPRANSLIGGKSDLHTMQPASHIMSRSSDKSDRLSFHQASQFPQENLLLPRQHHHHSLQLQQQQQLLSHQPFQKQASQQHQGVVTNETFHSPQMPSDIGALVKIEPGFEHLNEVLQPLDSEQLQLPELQSQFPQSGGEDPLMTSHFSSLPSATHDTCSILPSNHQQILQPHDLVAEAQIQCDGRPSLGAQSKTFVQGQPLPESEDRSSLRGRFSHDQNVQQEFYQRIHGHDEARSNNVPFEGSSRNNAVRAASGPPGSAGGLVKPANFNRERHYFNQQKWLLILHHARCCKEPEGKCIDYCFILKKLWKHMDACNASSCVYPRCHHTKLLVRHIKQCRNLQCPVCVPVNNRLTANRKKTCFLHESDSGLQISVSGAIKVSNAVIGETKVVETSECSPAAIEIVLTELQPSLKRIKTELSSHPVASDSGNVFVTLNSSSVSHPPVDVQPQEFWNNDRDPMQVKSEFKEIEREGPGSSVPFVEDAKKDVLKCSSDQKRDNGQISNGVTSSAKLESVKLEKDADHVKPADVPQTFDLGVGTKSGKPKIKGVSLMELFTPEQVKEHIRGLRQWVGQSKAKAEKNQAMEHSMSENSCQLCAVEKLTFEPPPIYCTRCGSRIKRNSMYYTVASGDTRHYFCIPCYNEARGETIVVDGSSVPKSRLEKKKNDEETEEWWVQCDKCEAWQHQICALFNGRRNDGGQAEYTCPNCYIEEVERGERKPLPQSAVLGAKDLPRTILSDHIEQRMFRRLKQERLERARQQGKNYDEVPGVEGIVVRVVSSVDKKLEVKPRFLEIFREENYPTEFPYKSKVVLLFQKIEGVEVCLFGMYVQEFGSECLPPNQRRVYLSYLDSVKYFRPEVKAVTGEALRTFVYHEILIGYLEYCKLRGFTSCYIWACPPLKGEDYILYCHPEIQKTPKSDKLREWYLSMLRKASKENIAVELTNLYDHFFVTTGECKAKVTAARLPYFDGDYWPGAAEDTIDQLNQEEDGRKQNKKGTTKKIFTKRALKASGQSDLSSNASKDVLLMHRLGETILPMKADFIMVHLQYSCTHCCVLMVSGNRWTCKQCKNFQICEKCYEAEQKLDERESHPVGQKEKHTLYPFEITEVPEDTRDKDEILESEFFDTRQAFLSLCQGNHYQYDTLRRAKHSSMMVLYHLHNPTAPAFVITCNICHLDIETGQGWHCEICPDYDVCNACYRKEGGIDHPHKLTNHPSLADRDAQNKEARQLRVLQLRKMLDLLVHASKCRLLHCQYPNCRKVKGLFRHAIQCRTRASGGCVLCKKMWYLLHIHARACKESECYVPRCRDLKEHLRRLQQQSDSRRRAAVMEMMRQRAAEVAGNGG